MSPTASFRIQQVVVNLHLKQASIGRDQGNPLNFWLKFFQQFGCQTGSAISVMSDRAVGNGNIQ